MHVSIDEFGSGQTSLGNISTLPIDELKIDRSFVAGLLDRPADAAIVRSIVDIGHNLALRVVAEGIGTTRPSRPRERRVATWRRASSSRDRWTSERLPSG